jgi:hypothetical protein
LLKNVYHLIVRGYSNAQVNKKVDIRGPELGVGLDVEIMRQVRNPYMLPTAKLVSKPKISVKTMDDLKAVGKGKQVLLSNFPQTSYIGEVL